jgi:hypothetical protein
LETSAWEFSHGKWRSHEDFTSKNGTFPTDLTNEYRQCGFFKNAKYSNIGTMGKGEISVNHGF